MAKTTKRHATEMANIDHEIAEARGRCPHPWTERHPDPAGGSDSWTECRACGATLE